jgi:formyl-CoA transferase
MMQVLEEIFTRQPGSHWKRELDEKQLPADVIEKYDYPASDRIAAVNRYILNLEHPSHGAIQSLGFPLYMSESPARLRSMAPCVGQHSSEVLQERLGYTDAEIEALAAAGAVGS